MALSKIEKEKFLELLTALRETCMADDVGILWDFEDDIKESIQIMKRDLKSE